jgi:hypothetical protein
MGIAVATDGKKPGRFVSLHAEQKPSSPTEATFVA